MGKFYWTLLAVIPDSFVWNIHRRQEADQKKNHRNFNIHCIVDKIDDKKLISWHQLCARYGITYKEMYST